MNRRLLSFLALLLAGVAFTPSGVAQTTVGYVSYDVTGPNVAEFDITNLTGINSFANPDANPITTSVNLSTLELVVSFATGPTEVFGPSYFTLDADGISWDGTALSTVVGQPGGFAGAVSATLTGDFSPLTLTLADSTTETIDPTFSATIIGDGAGGLLQDGDLQIISVTPGGSVVTPEPESLVLFGTGLTALAGLRRRRMIDALRRASRKFAGLGAALAVACFFLVATSAQAQVKLAVDTVPSSGLAGYNNATTTGTGFPAGKIAGSSVTVSFSTTCEGAPAATESATSVTTVIGTTDRVAFAIPGSLTAGTYFVSVTGSSPAFTTNSSYCSQIAVSATSTTLASCVPTSSIAVTVGTNVLAYVPFGYWESSTTGIEEVVLEGTGTVQNFATTGAVNSCASNSVTGEVVCSENTANVDLINGNTLTTITSGSNTYKGFSGGSCENCGVAINASNNTAVIGMGVNGGSSGSGVQVLNLANNTFNAPFPMTYDVSENISLDSGRNLILSPGEDYVYDLIQVGSGGAMTEYANSLGDGGYYLDSAAEDCLTGIALSADEFTDAIYITDLTQAVYTAGTPGSWTAPGQFYNLNDAGYAAGTSGISSAPGTNHLAVVTGEFGGSSYSILQLPSTSGSGTPTLADHAYVGSMPNTPDGEAFEAGFDPHTLTAYTSPNNNKSYAVFADFVFGYPDYLGVVDMACVLALPRNGDGITVTDGNAASCTRYVVVP